MRKLLVWIVLGAMVLSTGLVGLSADKRVVVGCKNFTEQFIIGEMMKQLLEARGFDVRFVSDISTQALREAMENGDVDICAEYTGTAWMTHLGYEVHPALDNNALYWAVKTVDKADNGFAWLDPIWNNNTYALACWPEFAEEHDVRTLSDLAALYNARDGKIQMFIDFEWSFRPDGLPFMEDYYGFKVDPGSIKTGSPGASVSGLENRQTEIAMVFATDAKIAKYDWHVFVDDRSFFPPYDLTPVVRTAVLERYPELEEILNELVATFPGGGAAATPEIVAECQGVWQGLNAKVNIDRFEADEVAREYLVDHGLIDGS